MLPGSGTDWDVWYKFYNTTSNTWNNLTLISNESTGFSAGPEIVVDSENNIHTTWDDRTNILGAGTDADIFYKTYNTTSNTWSTYTLISNESTDDSDNPNLATDSENNIHIVWDDRTDNMLPGSGTDQDIWLKTLTQYTNKADIDITTASITYDQNNLYTRLQILGNANTENKTYRTYISTDSTTGTNKNPENQSLPFNYDYRIETTKNICTIYNFTNDNEGTCTSDNNTNQIETSTSLTTLGITPNEIINITTEANSITSRDLAPNLDSFIEQTTIGPPTVTQ